MSCVQNVGQFFDFNWLPWQRPLTNWKIRIDPSSASKVLSYGENIVKIRPVCPEIFIEIRLFFGLVVPDVLKRAPFSLELPGRSSPNVDTI